MGSSNVGKTSLIHYLIQGQTVETGPTVSGDYVNISSSLDNQQVDMQLWDTAGQEQYQSITPIYLRNANIILVTFSWNDTLSFNKCDEWYRMARDVCGDLPQIVLIGNKNDLEPTLLYDDVVKFANEVEIPLISTSCQNGDGIETLKNTLVQLTIDHYNKSQKSQDLSSLTKSQQSACC